MSKSPPVEDSDRLLESFAIQALVYNSITIRQAPLSHASHDRTVCPGSTAYTDGACSGNPGPGGWAFILRHLGTGKETEEAGAEKVTTNNRMELTAVVRGLETPDPYHRRRGPYR